MLSPNTFNESPETPTPSDNQIAEPNFEGKTPVSITEFAGRTDFPKCTLGEFVNIGGFTGMVVEIVKQSLKVRSQEGSTRTFNSNGLKKLYAPALPPEPEEISSPSVSISPSVTIENEPTPAASAEPARRVITEPDFNQPLKAIRVFASAADFPECAFGKYVDVRGYEGVVVEIVGGSLKIKSTDGMTRSYNAVGLRKLYGD